MDTGNRWLERTGLSLSCGAAGELPGQLDRVCLGSDAKVDPVPIRSVINVSLVEPEPEWESLAATDLAAFEIDGDSTDALLSATDDAGVQIDVRRDFTAADVDDGVVASFGENVDQHLQGQWVV
jgi:hypothetical protein